VLCALVIGVLAIVPAAAVREDAQLAQAIMPIILAGLVAGLAHGVGYVPRNGVVARLISPLVSWPLMLSALAFLVLRSS
jgi:predicted membrane protein